MLYCENANDHGILIRTGKQTVSCAPRVVQIALRYHDRVARMRYLLTNALSACGYRPRGRGAPAADASAEALIAGARHARVLLQCMSLLPAHHGRVGTSARCPLLSAKRSCAEAGQRSQFDPTRTRALRYLDFLVRLRCTLTFYARAGLLQSVACWEV